MEEGEISSDSELAPSVLEVPTINWTNNIGKKRTIHKDGARPKSPSTRTKQLGPGTNRL